MLVTNLQSPRSGQPVANQYLIVMDDGTRIFRSYLSNVCKIDPNGTIYLDEYYWNYSRTTTKYLKEFLQMNIEQIHANMRAGIFKTNNLNR